jgi:hypothetical protein
MASQPRTCIHCSGPISRDNRSGYCKGCTSVAIKRALAADPARKAALVARARAIHRLPQSREARRRRWVENRYWERGNAALPAGCEARKRGGKVLTARRLAWCPPALRSQYLELVNRKRVKAAEARRLILEQHEIEMRRWRRSIGAEPEIKPDIAPARGLLFIDRASAVAAAHAGVPDIWVRTRDKAIVRARWAIYLALYRGGWTVHRIARETGMERKGVGYALGKAEILAAVPGEFAELLRKVVAA